MRLTLKANTQIEVPAADQLTIDGGDQLPLPVIAAQLEFSKRRLTVGGKLSRVQHVQIGRFLKESGESLIFWKTDWIAAMRNDLGDDESKTVLLELGFEQTEFKLTQRLASLDLRDSSLSSQHHFVLAKSKLDEVSRDMWVQLAKKESLSPSELQESIRVGYAKHIEQDRGETSAGIATWDALAMDFEILRRQIGEKWRDWTIEEIKTVLTSLSKITSFAEALQMRQTELAT